MHIDRSLFQLNTDIDASHNVEERNISSKTSKAIITRLWPVATSTQMKGSNNREMRCKTTCQLSEAKLQAIVNKQLSTAQSALPFPFPPARPPSAGNSSLCATPASALLCSSARLS
jgi:hypothetical protein